MGIASFKKTVWEEALLKKFRGISVAEAITTPPVSTEGAKCTFNAISGGTIKDYTGTIAWEEATTTPIDLVYDKKKYFALSMDDCDKVQAAGEVLLTLAQEKAYELKEVIDTDIMVEMAKIPTVGNKQQIGTSAAPISVILPSAAYDNIVDLGTILSTKKVPATGRFVLAKAEYVNQMAKDPRFVSNFNVLPNGIVQGATINGMQVVQCEEVPAGTVLCVHKSAFGFGKQIDKLEALRLQTSFADGVRGLLQYGRVALRTEGVASLLYKMTA